MHRLLIALTALGTTLLWPRVETDGVVLLPQLLVSTSANAQPSGAARVAVVDLGSVRVRLEETTLAGVRHSLGGAVVSGGDAANSWRALCYRITRNDSAVWLIATEMSSTNARIMLVAVDIARPWSGCSTPKLPVLFDPQPLPAIGSTRSDLSTYFKVPLRDSDTFAFEHVTILPHGGARVERIAYRLERKHTTRIVVSRITTY